MTAHDAPAASVTALDPATSMSESISWSLVKSVNGQKVPFIVGNLAIPLVAAIGWKASGRSWLLWWAAAMLAVLAGRLVLMVAFDRTARPADAPRWARRFTAGAWISGLLWGGAGVAIADGLDPAIQLVVLATQSVAIMGGAARNAGCLRAAYGQVVLAVTPVSILCLLSPRPLDHAFAGLTVLETIASLSMSTTLHAKTVETLTLSERNAVLAASVRETSEKLATANAQLEAAAMSDALTGIANRRRFDVTLANEIGRIARRPTELSLLILDIDRFKQFNDRYGHVAGDVCLQRVAAALSSAIVRQTDLVARYGGEEFAAILVHTGPAGAATAAERARRAIAELNIPHAGSPEGIVTASFGVASFSVGRHRLPTDLIAEADTALYRAKAEGRNRVRCADTGDTARAASAVPAEALPS